MFSIRLVFGWTKKANFTESLLPIDKFLWACLMHLIRLCTKLWIVLTGKPLGKRTISSLQTMARDTSSLTVKMLIRLATNAFSVVNIADIHIIMMALKGIAESRIGRDFDNPEVKAWLKRQRKMEVK